MQESWEFDMLEPLEETNNPADTEVIKRLLEQNKKEMGIFLSYYYKGDGGLAEEVEINHISFTTPTSGTLSVSYNVVYFNACLDIHNKEVESMPLYFTVNEAQNKVELTGPRWPEREPDEI